MNNLIVDSSLNASLNSSTKSDSLIKFIIFEIGKLTLALPILHVQKIIKQNEVHGSGLSHINLTHLPDKEVTIVDLHQKLFGVSLTHQNTTGYFIISQDIAGEALGIVVAAPPTLIEIPIDQIRLIPDSYRRSDTLEIASHVAIIPQNDKTWTVFILDLSRLV